MNLLPFSLSLRGMIAAAALASVLPAAAEAQMIVLDENFEAPRWVATERLLSTPTNGWRGNDNNSDLFSRVVAYESGQSLRLWDGVSTGSASATYHLGENITQGHIEFSVRNTGSGNLYLYGQDAGSTAGADRNFLLVISSTQITFRSIVAGQTSVETVLAHTASGYTHAQWNTLRVEFDNATKTASLLVNGTSVAGSVLTDLAADWFLGTFQLVAGANSSTGAEGYFDNIKVFDANAIPEPSAAAMIFGAFVLGAAALRRRRG